MQESPVTLRIAEELRLGGIRVSLEHNLLTVARVKLLVNITANPLTALTGRRVDIFHEENIEDIARIIMSEAVLVGKAEGADLTDRHIDQVMCLLKNLPSGSTTSMRQDRLSGRMLEYDALTGAIVRAANKHGIQVPVNKMILALLSAIVG